MKKSTGFTEDKTSKELFKSSVFKKIWNDRKNILKDSDFPAPAKGLQFPDPCLTLGQATYAFQTNEVADKLVCKTGDQEFGARFKKDKSQFDISYKQKLNENMSLLTKYEEKGDKGVHYVVGSEFKSGPISGSAKFNMQNQNLKASGLFDASEYVKGLTCAGEFKGTVPSLLAGTCPAYNIGAFYKGPVGTTMASMNKAGMVTVCHAYQVDKSLSVAAEIIQGVKGDQPKNPLLVGVNYKMDANTTLKARANKDMCLQVAVKRTLQPGLHCLACTTLDLTNPEKAMKAPAVGFKIATDGVLFC